MNSPQMESLGGFVCLVMIVLGILLALHYLTRKPPSK